jgi:hypothetical protein
MCLFYLALIDHMNLKAWQEWRVNLIKFLTNQYGMELVIFVWVETLNSDGLEKNL